MFRALLALSLLLSPDLAAQPAPASGGAAGADAHGGRRSTRRARESPVRAAKGPGARMQKGAEQPSRQAPRARKGGVDGDGQARAGVANSFLSQGKTRAAALAYRRQLVDDPDAPSLHVGLGRALARLGSCDEALDHLQPYVGYTPFGTEAALAASDCASRLGLYYDAVWYARMAVEHEPESARALTTLALGADRLGDDVTRSEALYQLESLERDASVYARAALALRAGDLDELDVQLQFLLRDGRSSSDAVRLSAAAWLDLDHPVATAELLASVMRPGHARVGPRVLRAEALRRAGGADQARNVLAPERGLPIEGIEGDAVMARALVDLGDLAAAEERLRPYVSYEDAEVLASRWYLARARSEADAMAALEAAYDRAQTSRIRRLVQLVPVDAR